MKLLHVIDNFLNKYTTYFVVLNALIIISTAAIILGFFGMISYSGTHLLQSVAILLIVCFVANLIFSKIFNVPSNKESSLITALILFLIMQPAESTAGIFGLLLAGVISMGSKYILQKHKKHIFNPAALAVFVLGFNAATVAIWWVATPMLLPFTAILGLLIVRKIRKFHLFFSFLITAFLTVLTFRILNNQGGPELIIEAFTSWPLVFFATVMLTEPRTIPSIKKYQMIYGLLTGVLFGAQFRIGPIYASPEFALIIGNIFTFFVNPKHNFQLAVSEIKKLSSDIYGFSFTPDEKLSFAPGQYLEWTVPHKRPDLRGNRRYFTIASSPTEDKLQLGVKISEGYSSYKTALLKIDKGTKVLAGSLSGDFMLPENATQKLVFIAGGIGITPFRSMIKYLVDTKQKRDLTLFYVSASPSDFVYKDLFDQAGYSTGVKTLYVITKPENTPKNWNGRTGRINEQMIREEVPDYKERKFYISGPNAMIQAYKEILASLEIAKTQIITDYFPGF
ncbi:MAG TPA: RnfABCDGE type electron transport complex subunit D [Xanthomonadales bacterium]|nr:RnfABCDGE type electron transport complex subunit D [Xanthomonadales bacterium]